jgi:hypothetical protein
LELAGIFFSFQLYGLDRQLKTENCSLRRITLHKDNFKDQIRKYGSISLRHQLKRTAYCLLPTAYCLLFLLIPSQAIAQSQEAQSGQAQAEAAGAFLPVILPDNLGGDWRAVNRMRILKSDEWGILPDAPIYTEYGLQRLHSQVYSKDNTKATIEIFEMRYPSEAYGLFTFNRGSLSANRREFYVGSYLISIDSVLNDQQLDSSLIEILKKNLTNQSGNLPPLPSRLPEPHKIAGSEKYLVGPAALATLKGFSKLKEVIKFDGGVEAVVADYKNGDGTMSLMIIEYHTPQLASDGLKSTTKYLDSLSQNEKASSILKRVGNYLVHAINIKDTTEAENLIGQIKYEYKVYWEGRRLSDIPIEFRPPDPAVVEEGKRTLLIVIRSFYWLGILMASSLLLGLVAGGTFFYWRRYRRRKLGLDVLFSDAGESIRLNLEDYLLQPGKSPVKQLGDGNKM